MNANSYTIHYKYHNAKLARPYISQYDLLLCTHDIHDELESVNYGAVIEIIESSGRLLEHDLRPKLYTKGDDHELIKNLTDKMDVAPENIGSQSDMKRLIKSVKGQISQLSGGQDLSKLLPGLIDEEKEE